MDKKKIEEMEREARVISEHEYSPKDLEMLPHNMRFEELEKETGALETKLKENNPISDCMRGVPSKVKTKIVLTEDDVKCVVGKIIESVGGKFTVTEFQIHAGQIGAEILGNAMMNRMDKKTAEEILADPDWVAWLEKDRKRIIPNWNTVEVGLHPADRHFLKERDKHIDRKGGFR